MKQSWLSRFLPRRLIKTLVTSSERETRGKAWAMFPNQRVAGGAEPTSIQRRAQVWLLFPHFSLPLAVLAHSLSQPKTFLSKEKKERNAEERKGAKLGENVQKK